MRTYHNTLRHTHDPPAMLERLVHGSRLAYSTSIMTVNLYGDVDIGGYAQFASGHEIRGQSCVKRPKLCAFKVAGENNNEQPYTRCRCCRSPVSTSLAPLVPSTPAHSSRSHLMLHPTTSLSPCLLRCHTGHLRTPNVRSDTVVGNGAEAKR